MNRKAISDKAQNSVLLRSRRRCCLCFWLKGIDEVVKGQIAHLDQNHENAQEQNLVFLCHNHHDEYDSRTSTSKGLREGEVRKWRDELYREMEYRFRTAKSKGLVILFDESRHCFQTMHKAFTYRITIRNIGTATVKNVAAKITSITSSQKDQNDELKKYVGLKLSLSENPFGDYSQPDNPPGSSVILHPGEEATFDFVRLCILPGNFSILHANFLWNSNTKRFEQRPRGVISAGQYTIAISVQGDDLEAEEQQFEVSSSKDSVTFIPGKSVS